MVKKQIRFACIVVVAFGMFFSGCDTATQVKVQKEESKFENAEVIPGQYIVVLDDSSPDYTLPSRKALKNEPGISRADINRGPDRGAFIQSAKKLLATHNIAARKVSHYYSHAIKGFTAELDEESLKALKNDPRVAYIESDIRVTLAPAETFDAPLPKDLTTESTSKTNFPEGVAPQRTAAADFFPYGVSRVGGAVDASGYYAWVIDTGVDLDHPDLNVNTTYSVSFVDSEPSPNDNNGHGSHVAGTIAAVYNGYGVVGVAANATIFAVKALDASGSGSYSDLIAALDYVARYAFAGEPVNISIGGPPSDALDQAVINCAEAGVEVVVAAGNSSTHAGNTSPARVDHPNVWTVSAIDWNDDFASFSNYGNPPVDFAAPGVGVWSTWKNGEYNKISGTSMAAPHVTGLLVTDYSVSDDGYADYDPDGNPDPIAHR